MKKNRFIITFLVITAMLVSVFAMPMTAMAASGVIAYEFNMASNAPSSSMDNAPVAYNVSWNESDALNYHNRVRDGVWKHWFDVNYTSIGTGDDFTAFCMEFTNETKVPGLSKDFSAYAESGCAIFDIELEETVDINNLYFAVATLNNGTTAYAGVPVADYLSDSNRAAVVAVPFSEFEFIGGKTAAATAIDFSKFAGMGIIRKQATGAQSSGKVKFAQMAVAGIDAPTDLAATTAKNKNTLSFTMPAGLSVESVIINVKDDSNNERNITTAIADWTADGDVYSWTDAGVEVENGYTYKIKITESTYGIESAFSNTAYAFVSEDYSGNDIPANANDTEVVFFSNRNYTWPLPEGITWHGQRKLMDNPYDNNILASTVGMGAGYVTGYQINYGQRASEDTNKSQMWFPDNWYFAGWGHSESTKGGVSGTDRQSQNIAAHADTASVYYQIYIDEGVDLNNLYFTIANQWAGGNDYWSNHIGLPVTDFVSEEDKGKVIEVVIPLSKFTLDYPGMKQEQEAATWAASAQPSGVAEIDWTHFWAIGFMRDDSNPGESTGMIYCSEMVISDVEPVTELKTYDIKEGKVILSWKHSKSAVEKYNIYRKDLETGEYALIGESTTDMFVDTNGEEPFVSDTTYEYKIEAIDKYGVASPGAEVSAYVSAIDRPRNFRANAVYSATDAVEVAVSWAPAQYGDAQRYVLYKDGREYQTFDTTVNEFVDTDVVANTTYEYYMVATNADGSAKSIETQHVSVMAVSVGAPANLKYSVVDTNSLSLTWDAADFADKYIIYLNGEKCAETGNTEYTIANLEFNKQYIVSVVSQNVSGAVSNETKTDKIIISNPEVLEAIKIFTDKPENGFSLDSSISAKAVIENEMSVSGTSSLFIDFTTRNYSAHTAGFKHGKFNLSAYREANNNIAFWIYADYEFDFADIDLALGSNNTYNGSTVDVYSKVNLADYVTGYGEWKYVSIPLKAFADRGVANAGAYEIQIDQKFNDIKKIVFMTRNSAVDTLASFLIDEMVITKEKDWSISEVKSDDGTVTTSKIPTTATSFDITFNKAIDEEEAKELSVSVTDASGNVLNSYGKYENGVYTITLLESLAPDTRYTVDVNGTTVNFVTDSTPAGEIGTAIPAAKADITTYSNGSVIEVTVALDGDIDYTAKKYDITIKYDGDRLALNDEDAVELKGAFKNADVVCTDEDIKISGNMNSKVILNGDVAFVEFVKQSSGNADIEVDGTVYYYNEEADKETAVKVTGSKTVDVTISGGGGGGGSSSGGGVVTGGAAGRGSAPVMGPDRTPAAIEGSVVEFTDINDVPWAQPSIKYLAGKGYISGYGDGTFKPAQAVTRAEFVKMCVTVFAIQADSTDSGFVDVAEDAWYAKYIAAAKNAGLVNGISETHFGVNETISREDMCTIIDRIIAKMYIVTEEVYDAPLFEDRAEISEYAKAPVTNLYKCGIINGVSETEFSPKTDVNRAMAAKVLYAVAMLMD